MPVDKSMVDPSLNPFRGMMKEIDDKKLTGKDVDEMRSALTTMERLAEEMDDVVSYMTKLTTENLFLKFSNAYGKVLSKAAQSSAPTDDAGMMRNTLQQYENSLTHLKKNPDHAHLVGPVQKIVDIGKSGVSYPVFLRMCEEQQLFEEMKNGSQKPQLEFDLHVAQVMGDPIREAMYKKMLDTYNAMSARSKIGLADHFEFSLARQKIEWEYAPEIARWKAIVERWDKMHDMVLDWIDAHCSFAPTDARWIDPSGDRSKTLLNIRRTKECNPGRLKVREDIFREYFDLSFDDVWNHPTYLAEQKASRIYASDERIECIKKAYPHCKPGGAPPADVISKTEAIFRAGTWRSRRHIERFGDGATKAPGYDFQKFGDFVRKHMSTKTI